MRILCSQVIKHLRCAVRTVVVHHNNIKVKRSLLSQSAVHSISDGTYPVSDRNNDTGLHVKLCCLFGNVIDFVARHESFHSFQVVGADLFHFDLHLTLCRIHIVKL